MRAACGADRTTGAARTTGAGLDTAAGAARGAAGATLAAGAAAAAAGFLSSAPALKGIATAAASNIAAKRPSDFVMIIPPPAQLLQAFNHPTWRMVASFGRNISDHGFVIEDYLSVIDASQYATAAQKKSGQVAALGGF